MRLILLDDDGRQRPVGAAVVRSAPDGGVLVEFGPADGAAMVRLSLSHREALRVSDLVRLVANGGSEGVILVEEP